MKNSATLLIAAPLAAALLVGCGKSQSGASPSNSASADNPPGGYLGALANSQDHAVKVVDTASLNQAVQLFNATEGRFPKDLNELVTNKLIGEIPPTPRGKKLDYNPTTGEVKVVDE